MRAKIINESVFKAKEQKGFLKEFQEGVINLEEAGITSYNISNYSGGYISFNAALKGDSGSWSTVLSLSITYDADKHNKWSEKFKDKKLRENNINIFIWNRYGDNEEVYEGPVDWKLAQNAIIKRLYKGQNLQNHIKELETTIKVAKEELKYKNNALKLLE